MFKWQVALVPIGVGVMVLGGSLQKAPTENVFDTSGQEVAQEGAIYLNGWNVQNHYDAKIKDTYTRYQDLLGEPVSGWNGTSQSFRFGKLIYTPSRPDDWKIEFGNTGMEDLQVNGYTPQLNSTPHPALRDWLQSRNEDGMDIVRVIGPIISQPTCDKKANICRQWSAKSSFSFPADSLDGQNVVRLPVGLWLSHPKTRAVEKTNTDGWLKFNPITAVIGGIVSLAGVVGLVRSRGNGGGVTI
jgi:hypothetical protein